MPTNPLMDIKEQRLAFPRGDAPLKDIGGAATI
jgi:hypothetical protein